MKILKIFWERWLKIAHVIGNFQAQVILTVFYFVFLLPVGLVYSFISDPLKKNPKKIKTNFEPWVYSDRGDIEKARKQF